MAESFGLYVILTEPVAGYTQCTEAAVAEGVRYVQLRMKDTPHAHVVKTARLMRTITRGTKTLFIVNDDPGVAAEVDADGVHLGQGDMSLQEARALWPEPGKIFGLSTHNENEARAALEHMPDYIGIGPVYPTPTKAVPDPALGLGLMGKIAQSTHLTTVAIGGINADNLPEVIKAGAVNFACVRPVCSILDPQPAIRHLMNTWKKYSTV